MKKSGQPTRIIDTHQHVFWHGRDDKGLIADMDDHKINYAWLLSWEIYPEEDRGEYHKVLNPIHIRTDGTHKGIPLSDLILAKERYPDRFVLGYCPHPTKGNASAFLRAAHQIHGVKVCGEWKFRVLFDDPRCIELFRTAGELKMPVVLHLDVPFLLNANGKMEYVPSWYGGTVDNLERALQACPETTFLGHAPGFWREISADAAKTVGGYPKGPVKKPGKIHKLMDQYSNLWLDLSAGSGENALKRDPKHAVEFVTKYQDRILFARDYYGQSLHQFLMTLKLPKQVIEKIYHRNAEKLVTLD